MSKHRRYLGSVYRVPLAVGSMGFLSCSNLDRSHPIVVQGCLRSTHANRNPPQQSAPFVKPPSNGPLVTAWDGKVKFQTAEWLCKGFVDFGHYVIGAEVVDSEEGFGHVRYGAGRQLRTFDQDETDQRTEVFNQAHRRSLGRYPVE